jgi:hypothetical protein
MPNIGNNLLRDLRVLNNDTPKDITLKQALVLEQAMGLHGNDYFSDTSQHDGQYCALQACEATVVASATGEGISWSNVTLAAGQTVPGYFTSVTLTSGSVILYKSASY